MVYPVIYHISSLLKCGSQGSLSSSEICTVLWPPNLIDSTSVRIFTYTPSLSSLLGPSPTADYFNSLILFLCSKACPLPSSIHPSIRQTFTKNKFVYVTSFRIKSKLNRMAYKAFQVLVSASFFGLFPYLLHSFTWLTPSLFYKI